MAFVPATCTQCGAAIEVDDTHEAGVCKYCGTAFVTEKVINHYHNTFNIQHATIQGAPTEENLILRAKKFEEEGNIDKAIEYYNRVLDLNINSIEANIGLLIINLRILQNNGDLDGALTCAKKILEYDPEQIEAKKIISDLTNVYIGTSQVDFHVMQSIDRLSKRWDIVYLILKNTDLTYNQANYFIDHYQKGQWQHEPQNIEVSSTYIDTIEDLTFKMIPQPSYIALGVIFIIFLSKPILGLIILIAYSVYKFHKTNKDTIDRCYLCKKPSTYKIGYESNNGELEFSKCFKSSDGQLFLHDTCLNKINLPMDQEFINTHNRSELLQIIKNEINRTNDDDMKKNYLALLDWMETDKTILNAKKMYKKSIQDRLNFLNSHT